MHVEARERRIRRLIGLRDFHTALLAAGPLHYLDKVLHCNFSRCSQKFFKNCNDFIRVHIQDSFFPHLHKEEVEADLLEEMARSGLRGRSCDDSPCSGAVRDLVEQHLAQLSEDALHTNVAGNRSLLALFVAPVTYLLCGVSFLSSDDFQADKTADGLLSHRRTSPSVVGICWPRIT